jgi:hypothetical protein
MPLKVMRSLAHLNAVSDETWRLVERADKAVDNWVKVRALCLAQRAALDIVNVVTNNETLIDEALKSQRVKVLEK